jgi:hypothetical protein
LLNIAFNGDDIITSFELLFIKFKYFYKIIYTNILYPRAFCRPSFYRILREMLQYRLKGEGEGKGREHEDTCRRGRVPRQGDNNGNG